MYFSFFKMAVPAMQRNRFSVWRRDYLDIIACFA